MELKIAGREIDRYTVLVQFGAGIDSNSQASAMFAMEKMLRDFGIPAEVYKHTMQDDSKLRRSMTTEERAQL